MPTATPIAVLVPLLRPEGASVDVAAGADEVVLVITGFAAAVGEVVDNTELVVGIELTDDTEFADAVEIVLCWLR